MEWGATAFPSSIIMPLATTIFPSPSEASSSSSSSSSDTDKHHTSPTPETGSNNTVAAPRIPPMNTSTVKNVLVAWQTWLHKHRSPLPGRPIPTMDANMGSLFAAASTTAAVVLAVGSPYYASDDEATVRFDNFKVHVALARNLPFTDGTFTENEGEGEGKRQGGEWFNGLADLSMEEFEASYRGCAKVDSTLTPSVTAAAAAAAAAARTSHYVSSPSSEASPLPESIDWRNSTTPVKNQGQCGEFIECMDELGGALCC